MLFDLSTSAAEGVNGRGYIHSLTVSDIRLDTINFSLIQRKERLSFGGQVRNNKKNPQFVFNALFDGILQERGATLGVRYFDADNKLGARIGAQAEVVDGGINLRLMPDRRWDIRSLPLTKTTTYSWVAVERSRQRSTCVQTMAWVSASTLRRVTLMPCKT